MYDIIIRNGRVIDPQNKFDAKAQGTSLPPA